ncbi:MAG: hemerythrin domain-containing protein [Rhodospirillales bacterium]
MRKQMRSAMARYVWDDEYNTGNEKIDDQHRMIFDAANMLFEAVKQSREEAILDQSFDLLMQYTNTHFKDEEEYYKEIHSPLLETQQDEHRVLLDDLREMWREKRHGSADAGTDLDHWMERRLIPHIIKEDTRAQKAAKTRPPAP